MNCPGPSACEVPAGRPAGSAGPAHSIARNHTPPCSFFFDSGSPLTRGAGGSLLKSRVAREIPARQRADFFNLITLVGSGGARGTPGPLGPWGPRAPRAARPPRPHHFCLRNNPPPFSSDHFCFPNCSNLDCSRSEQHCPPGNQDQ